jgi:hypothetical protein
MKSITSIALMLLMLASCGPDLEDCESKAELFTGAWIIKEVFIDDQRQEPTSYKAYRLSLDGSGDFQRSQPAGFPDEGRWSLASGETVLVIEPNISPAEDYVIESFDLRELVLVLNRNSSKEGPSKIRYILIPEE